MRSPPEPRMSELVVERAEGPGLEALERFLDMRADATIFHRAAWQRVVEASYGHRCDLWIARRDGEVRGCFPVMRMRAPFAGEKHVALPYQFATGAPLAADAGVATALIERAAREARAAGAKFLEIRSREPIAGAAELGLRVIDSQLVTTDLDLATFDEKALSRGIRREVGYAREAGLVIEDATDREGLDSFLDLYLPEMRAHGAPQAGRVFFATLARVMPKNVFVHLARLGGELVGGILVLGDDRLACGRGIAGQTARGRACFAGKALTHAAIVAARRRGVATFHMGMTFVGDRGLASYKDGWRGRTSPVLLSVLPLAGAPPEPGSYFEGFALAKALWRRLPLFLCDAIGHRVTRWIG
jgi:hypothetical protein